MPASVTRKSPARRSRSRSAAGHVDKATRNPTRKPVQPVAPSRAGGWQTVPDNAPVRVAVADSAAPRADPAAATSPPPAEARQRNEPVWLVRAVLVLFLIGFAAFLARELRNFLSSLA